MSARTDPLPRSRAILARLVTGPAAFALAGVIDVLAVLFVLGLAWLRRRYHRPGDVR